MKDKLASYNHLIETFVIVTETFLCGLQYIYDIWDIIGSKYSI